MTVFSNRIAPRVGMILIALVVAISGISAGSTQAATSLVCGSTIKTSTTMTSDLVCAAGNGLTLYQGVTLDLGGHKLIGAGGKTVAVTLSLLGPSTVTNGTLQNWGTAVANGTTTLAGLNFVNAPVTTQAALISDDGFSGSPLAFVEGPDGSATVTINRSHFTTSDIDASLNDNVTVNASSLTNSSIAGFSAVVAVNTSSFVGGVISDYDAGSISVDASILDGAAIVSEGDCDGIVLLNSTVKNYKGNKGAVDGCIITVSNNTFSNNTVAIHSTFSLYDVASDTSANVFSNTFTGNGIAVDSHAGMNFFANTLTGNTTGVLSATDQAIRTIRHNTFANNTSSGIHSADTGATIAFNTATGNGRYGIYAPGAKDGGGNVASGNKLTQCVGIVCASQ